jgi:hypothetical protein
VASHGGDHRRGSPTRGYREGAILALIGAQVLLTLGRHGKGAWGPERARREAIRLLGLIRAVGRAEDKAAPSLADFSAEHAERRKKKRSVEEDRRLLRLHVLPELGHLGVRAITKTDVVRLLSSLHARPVAGEPHSPLLSGMLGWDEPVVCEIHPISQAVERMMSKASQRGSSRLCRQPRPTLSPIYQSAAGDLARRELRSTCYSHANERGRQMPTPLLKGSKVGVQSRARRSRSIFRLLSKTRPRSERVRPISLSSRSVIIESAAISALFSRQVLKAAIKA